MSLMRPMVPSADVEVPAGAGFPPFVSSVRGTPVALTLSGNEVTDAVRAAGLSGDGLAAEGSVGVWEATTNLLPNGGGESNTTGWVQLASASISRITSEFKFGSACFKVVANGAGSNEGIVTSGAPPFIAIGASTVYTLSAWVKAPNGATLTIGGDQYSSAPAYVGSVGANATGTGDWQRISCTFTSNGSAASIAVYVRTNGTQAITFYVDGFQLEQQPLATPYVETNGGTASRSASIITVPTVACIDETQAWFAARIRVGYPSSGGSPHSGGPPCVVEWGDDNNNRLSCFMSTGATPRVQRVSGGTGQNVNGTALTFSVGDYLTIIAAWDATSVKVSGNGAAFVTAGTPSIPVLAATSFKVGKFQANASLLGIDSDYFWFACGLGTLSDADAATIHANGNPDPAPGLFPTAAQLKLIWKASDQTARSY